MAERPDPRPAPGHLLITVRAAGVNFADIMGRMGLYPDAPPFPFVPGYEVAGTLPDGKRVIALTRFNGYAEKVVTPTEAVVPLPDALSFEEGAAIPVVYTTAWVALVAMARLAAGDRMLVEHAAGGVGLAAIQIARHAGAEVFGVVSSNAKAQFLQDLGVVPIVRSRDPWPQALDVILDPTGPSGLERDLRHLRPSGRLLLFGASEMVEGPTRRLLRVAWRYWRRPRLDLYVLMNRNRGVFGLNMLHLAEAPEIVSRALHEVMGGVADGWVKPRVDRTFPLAQAGQAHAYLQARKNIGKVVLIPG
jgi:NADPH:quinone reductase-like Zn-dependent oxidoreductase